MNRQVAKGAAAELIRAAEDAVRAAYWMFNEATAGQVDEAILRMDEAVAQLNAAAAAHANAVTFGQLHRVYLPVALDVKAILDDWRVRGGA